MTHSTNRSRPVTIEQFHTKVGAPVDRTLNSVRILVPASSPLYLTLQLILEQLMVELHSPPGRYTLILYLADYVNTLILLLYTLDNVAGAKENPMR